MAHLLITGVSGYIGGHVALQALQQGHTVRGTTRSASKSEEIRADLAAHVPPEALERFSVVAADLLSPEGWDEAVSGVDAVLHVASPFVTEMPKDEQELIRPARLGVKHVVEAAVRQGVERIVQTSSVVAVMYGHSPEKSRFTDQDWSDLGGPGVNAYTKSKTLAEQDLWALAERNPGLKVTCVNPGFVLGPLLGRDPGTSVGVIRRFMRGEFPGVPRISFTTVDVRDVAELHLRVLGEPETVGQRYLAVANTLWLKQMAEAILEACPAFSKKVKARELPGWMVRGVALFDATVRSSLPELGKFREADNAPAVALGWTPRTAQESVMDTARSLVEKGLANP